MSASSTSASKLVCIMGVVGEWLSKVMGFYCRYVNKGSDACVFSVDDPNRRDEIKMYELGRYISANEACWRIFGSQIHHHFPPLTHLVVHLPNGQRMHASRMRKTSHPAASASRGS